MLLIIIVFIIWALFQLKEYRANKTHQLQVLALGEVVAALHAENDLEEKEKCDLQASSASSVHSHEKEIELHEGFTIEFNQIGLKLKNGTSIMQSVSGKFLPGRLCAVMGPSGAGKTTIISLVTGKTQRTSGEVKVNGTVVDGLNQYKKLVGFVPQEDIMLRELTVRDNISFSANYR